MNEKTYIAQVTCSTVLVSAFVPVLPSRLNSPVFTNVSTSRESTVSWEIPVNLQSTNSHLSKCRLHFSIFEWNCQKRPWPTKDMYFFCMRLFCGIMQNVLQNQNAFLLKVDIYPDRSSVYFKHSVLWHKLSISERGFFLICLLWGFS